MFLRTITHTKLQFPHHKSRRILISKVIISGYVLGLLFGAVGCLAGRLAGWVAAGLDGWMARWLLAGLAGCWLGWLAADLVGWLAA